MKDSFAEKCWKFCLCNIIIVSVIIRFRKKWGILINCTGPTISSLIALCTTPIVQNMCWAHWKPTYPIWSNYEAVRLKRIAANLDCLCSFFTMFASEIVSPIAYTYITCNPTFNQWEILNIVPSSHFSYLNIGINITPHFYTYLPLLTHLYHTRLI